jgi:hypothetical protein
MTDDRTIDGGEQPADEPARVVRDSTFVRLFADNVIAQNLGRDIELCLIQFGGHLTHYLDSDTEGSVKHSNTVTEAGRVRFAWPIAVNLAMMILSQGVNTGLIDGDKLIQRLQEEIDTQKAGDGD